MKALFRFLQAHKTSITIFLSIGALCAIVNFSSFAFFWKLLGLNYQVAVSIAYVLSVIVHFLGNRNLTFKSYGHAWHKQITKYLTLVAFNYLMTIMVVHIVVEYIHLSPFIGLICAIGANICSGYLIMRFWVFKAIT